MIGIAPSIITATGGGLQVFWLLNEVIHIRCEDDRDGVKKLLATWKARVFAAADALGYKLDSAFDLTRVMRVPGSFNHKPEHTPPLLVRMLVCDPSRRYTISQLTNAELKLPVEDGAPEATAEMQDTHHDANVNPDNAGQLDDEAIIRAALDCDARFARLWAGDTADFDGDDSSADLALCNILAKLTGGSMTAMDRLFRQSKLMRGKWDEKRRDTTYGFLTINKALTKGNGHHRQAQPQPAAPTFVGPHGIRLTVTEASEYGTQGRIKATFAVRVGDADKAPLTVTSAPRSITDEARHLVALLAVDHDVSDADRVAVRELLATAMNRKVLVEVIADGRRRRVAATAVTAASTRTIESITIAQCAAPFAFTFREDDGRLWSESQGRPIPFPDFRDSSVTPALIQAVRQATDYPDDEPSASVWRIKQYVAVAWGELVRTLPREVDANHVGPASKAAQRYLAKLSEVWASSGQWYSTTSLTGQNTIGTTSLAALAERRAAELRTGPGPSGWVPVLTVGKVDAWLFVDPGETLHVWLAMTHRLIRQVSCITRSRLELPNTRDDVDLVALAARYGLSTADEAKGSQGRIRLAHGRPAAAGAK